MPTYEYECDECGKVFDLFHSITEPARKKLKKGDPRPCECNAGVSRRIGTGVGVIFKGSGFYQTDYRSESYNKAAKADSDAANGKDTNSEKKKSAEKTTESKAPDAKKTTTPAAE